MSVSSGKLIPVSYKQHLSSFSTKDRISVSIESVLIFKNSCSLEVITSKLGAAEFLTPCGGHNCSQSAVTPTHCGFINLNTVYVQV